jgi:hypothetical protein
LEVVALVPQVLLVQMGKRRYLMLQVLGHLLGASLLWAVVVVALVIQA